MERRVDENGRRETKRERKNFSQTFIIRLFESG
jgi:hypothetical protein